MELSRMQLLPGGLGIDDVPEARDAPYGVPPSPGAATRAGALPEEAHHR
jgi:hypothetical protein